jgi:hypothetical protein
MAPSTATLSDDGMPAAGSSSSRMRGLVASASAISRRRCLPVGQVRAAPRRVLGEAHAREQRHGFVRFLAMRRDVPHEARPAAGALEDRQHRRLEHGEIREELADLECAREAELHAAMLAKRGHALVADVHIAAAGRQRAREQVDERGLAGAVGADERMARALRQREGDAAHGG